MNLKLEANFKPDEEKIKVKKSTYLISLFLFSISAVVAYGVLNNKPSADNSLWVELSPTETAQNRVNIPSLAPLIEKAAPAVLVVTSEIKSLNPQLPPGVEQGPMGDFFRFFGPMQPPSDQETKAKGSGFIIHPSGLALTNHHMIEGAKSIKIKVGSALKEFDAEVIGSDETTDVALIKIKSDRKDWPVIPLGSSERLRVGDFAVAIGNPLGLELSAAFGMVSAKGRRDVHPSGRSGIFNFIQIDVPINPGNSGGVLMNLAGEAVGINTAISAAGQGIAFAIPIDQVKLALPQLKDKGHIVRAGLGIRIENVSPELAKSLGLPYAFGALVREVMQKSPAQKAGIAAGDIITEFDGKVVEDASALQLMASLAGVGKSIPLLIRRDGQIRPLRVTLAELPRENAAESEPPKQGSGGISSLKEFGLALSTNPDKDLKGAKVVQVDPQSVAAFTGIEVGDIIVRINDTVIKNAANAVESVKKTASGEALRLYLRRQNSTIFISITKP